MRETILAGSEPVELLVKGLLKVDPGPLTGDRESSLRDTCRTRLQAILSPTKLHVVTLIKRSIRVLTVSVVTCDGTLLKADFAQVLQGLSNVACYGTYANFTISEPVPSRPDNALSTSNQFEPLADKQPTQIPEEDESIATEEPAKAGNNKNRKSKPNTKKARAQKKAAKAEESAKAALDGNIDTSNDERVPAHAGAAKTRDYVRDNDLQGPAQQLKGKAQGKAQEVKQQAQQQYEGVKQQAQDQAQQVKGQAQDVQSPPPDPEYGLNLALHRHERMEPEGKNVDNEDHDDIPKIDHLGNSEAFHEPHEQYHPRWYHDRAPRDSRHRRFNDAVGGSIGHHPAINYDGDQSSTDDYANGGIGRGYGNQGRGGGRGKGTSITSRVGPAIGYDGDQSSSAAADWLMPKLLASTPEPDADAEFGTPRSKLARLPDYLQEARKRTKRQIYDPSVASPLMNEKPLEDPSSVFDDGVVNGTPKIAKHSPGALFEADVENLLDDLDMVFARSWTQKVVLVVGWGSLGRAMAKELKRRGAEVFVAELDENEKAAAKADGFGAWNLGFQLEAAKLIISTAGFETRLVESQFWSTPQNVMLAHLGKGEHSLHTCLRDIAEKVGEEFGGRVLCYRLGNGNVVKYLLEGGKRVVNKMVDVMDEYDSREEVDLSVLKRKASQIDEDRDIPEWLKQRRLTTGTPRTMLEYFADGVDVDAPGWSLPAVQTPATPPRERESVYYRRAGAGNAGSGGSADGGEFSLGLPPIQKSGGAGVMVGTGEHRKSGYGMSVAPPFTPTGKQIPLYVGGTGNGNGSGNEEARSPYGGSTTAHKTGTSGGTARQNAGSGRARRDDGKGERDDSGGDVEGNGGSFSDGDEV
ncbi:hypothetical protein HK097_011157 [Rhizophlyctis rosea]|uniref:S-adenosyl-L-homocysteine hydrolase NAD binding domain-containing protein n=1 Tax=Rhizophlyctis rosea TaxID=64517 RepID=A0AAD5X395_9FUNG|nr:hypothetical protein HK097_011157 [Rhizophlyctis rosea]